MLHSVLKAPVTWHPVVYPLHSHTHRQTDRQTDRHTYMHTHILKRRHMHTRDLSTGTRYNTKYQYQIGINTKFKLKFKISSSVYRSCLTMYNIVLPATRISLGMVDRWQCRKQIRAHSQNACKFVGGRVMFKSHMPIWACKRHKN